jgi:hypothetical protein
VADTTDATIGFTTEADLAHLPPMIKAMAEVTGLDYRPIVFADGQFLKNNVTKHLQQLQVGSDDVVLFYYSGHGGRSITKSSKWPDLYFRLDEAMVDLESMARSVASLRPRLGLVIADACNNVIVRQKIGRPLMSANSIDDRAVGNLVGLLRKSRGIWLAAGADTGEYSYADEGGGFFTSALLQSLNYGMLYAPELQWQEVFEVAAWTLQSIQQPIFQLWQSNSRSVDDEAA